jgi:hypothetical protein
VLVACDPGRAGLARAAAGRDGRRAEQPHLFDASAAASATTLLALGGGAFILVLFVLGGCSCGSCRPADSARDARFCSPAPPAIREPGLHLPICRLAQQLPTRAGRTPPPARPRRAAAAAESAPAAQLAPHGRGRGSAL